MAASYEPHASGRDSLPPAPGRRIAPDDDDQGSCKRQRTALACNSCRYRKSRCNGEHPVCSTCSEMGFQCVYRRPLNPNNKDSTLEYTAQLGNRLQAVEDLLQSVIGAGDRRHEQGDSHLSTWPARWPLRNDGEYSLGDGVLQPEWSERYASNVPPDDTVDGMGVITFADEAKSGYFGPSSNSAFFGHVARALASCTHTNAQREASSRDLTASLSRPVSPPLPSTRPKPKAMHPYTLPSRAVILRLVDLFFATTGLFFPYIHKKTIVNMVEELDLGRCTGIRKSWLCLLNAILAIGTSLDVDNGRPIKSRESESDIFLQRALTLSPWTISNTASLETLQALAVMTQYLQGTSRSAQTERLHGLFVQAAFQMGVHSNLSSTKFSPLEREIRTRTWYTCVVIDRMLSLTFGRPPLIHNEYLRIDLPLDVELDDIPNDDDGQFTGPEFSGTSSCGLFIASISLYRVQGDVIRELYDQNVLSSDNLRPGARFGKVLRLDQDLSDWKHSLPPALRLLAPQDYAGFQPQDWPCTRPQTVLTLRYLHVRLLLYRSVLVGCLDDIADNKCGLVGSDFSSGYLESMLKICTGSAVQIINLVHAVGSRPDKLPAWWFSAYFVFSAALIIFGLVVLQTKSAIMIDGSEPVALVGSLMSALEALEVIGKETRIVRRCSKCLKKLIQISSLLARNHSSGSALPLMSTVPNGVVMDESEPSATEGSAMSPLDASFGQFLVDDDFEFLNLWAEAVQQPE